MRRFLLFISVILLSVGCSVDEDEVYISNSISSRQVTIGAELSSSTDITMYLVENWQLELVGGDFDSADFEVSQESGSAGSSYTITFTALSSNETPLVEDLGTVNVVSGSTGDVIYSIDVNQNRKAASQVTLMYFMGTSLGSCYSTNISDAKSAIAAGALGSSGRFYYCLPSSKSKTTLYELTQNASGGCDVSQVASYDFNAYNSGSLSTVVAAVKSDCDFVSGGDNTMNLVLSSHGTAWIKTSASSYSSLVRSENFVMDRLKEWESVADAPVQTRYLGSTTDGSMNIEDLAYEMESIGDKFGYIIFDSCLMSSVEVLYRLRSYSTYIIASVAEIISFGFPYKTVVPQMFTNSGTNFNVQGICEAYYNYYSNESYYKYGTIAACVTSELEGLAEVQKSLSLTTLGSVSGLQSYDGYTNHVLFDLGDYVQSAVSDASDLESFNTQFDKAFPPACRLHTELYIATLGSYVSGTITYFSGVSTSAPTKSSTYHTEWLNEPWAVATE